MGLKWGGVVTLEDYEGSGYGGWAMQTG